MYITGFVTPDGQYEFLRMPFGMLNSGATLVRGLKKVLEGLSGVGGDSDSWEEHLRTLKELFGRLRRARIRTTETIFPIHYQWSQETRPRGLMLTCERINLLFDLI